MENEMDNFFKFCFIFTFGLSFIFLRISEFTVLTIIGTLAVFVWIVIVSYILTDGGFK